MQGRTIVAIMTVGLVGMAPGAFADPPAPSAPATAPIVTEEPGEAAAPVDDLDADTDGERPLGDDEAMVLNFERADIREVIHSLATALGLSYTIDPRIEGQVTIRTTGRIARKDLFPLFNAILRNNGIAAVKQGELYQMLPVAEAKTRAIIPKGEARENVRAEDSFVIEIMTLRHVAAEEMGNILQPFITPGGDVLAYPRANALVLTDIDSNVQRLRELVSTFDVDGFHNLHARVFKVKEGDPDELANELLALLTPYGVTPTGDGEAGVSFVPLSRLDAIVAFAIDRTAFTEIERWLAVLDVPPDQTSGRQTFVYNVENAKAADLAAVLNELFGGGSGGGGGGIGRNPRGQPAGVGLFGASGASGGVGGAGRGFGAANRRGGVGRAGGAVAAPQIAGGARGGAGGRGLAGRRQGGLGQAGGVAAAIPGAVGQAGGGAVLGVSLPGGPQGAPGGAPGLFGSQGPPPIFKEEVRIVADEVTNSLVVLATKRDYQLILDVVRKIDVVPRQVVLEVMIAEVVLNKDLQFGIAWAITEGRLVGTTGTGGDGGDGTSGGTTGTSIFDVARPPRTLGGLLAGGTRVPSNGAFAVISQDNFQAFINALQGLTNVKMLSAPHIIAADNREAHILVGQSIPILTSTSTAVLTGTAGSTVNQVQYRDTGKILTVLPQVNSLGLVNLQIRQEVSAVLQTANGAVTSFGNTNSPAFSTREAETTVVVQDGETVLIGGIIDDAISHTRSGLPFLMDVPVIGVLFRSEADKVERTELLITITPYVIRSLDEARRVTDDFSARIEGLTRLRRAMDAKRHRARREREEQDERVDPPWDAP